MIYFDSDVLVHYFIGYEPVRHEQAKQLIEEALAKDVFYVSQLSMQEICHVMGKFNQPTALIQEALSVLKSVSPINYDLAHFERATELAVQTGFSNINDCLHTAIAEAQNCTELITYNRKEFDRIRPLTNLTVTILASTPLAP